MSARGAYRCMFSVLFDDPDYQALAPRARLTLLTLRQCQAAGAAAIFRYYREILMAQTGLTAEELEQAFRELEAPRDHEPWIVRDHAVVWVRNALRFDPTLRLANALHRTGIENALKCLPRSEVVTKFCDYYQIGKPLERSPKTIGEAFADHFPPSPIPSPIPKPITKTEAEADSDHSPNGSGAPSSSSSVSSSSQRINDTWKGQPAGEVKW